MLVYNILKLVVVVVFMALSPFSHASDDAVPYGQNKAVGKYAAVNGIEIYYETYGTGAPLILIHGNGDSIAGLTAQIEYFSKKYQVIVADSRGHGKSGLGTDQLNYQQMMEDWNELLNQLAIKNAHTFGWSDGGIIGLLMAMKYPEKINKLAIMGANLRPDQTAVQPWAKPILEGAVREVAEMIAKKDATENWEIKRQLLNLVVTQPNINTKSLHQIKAPVLVIAGDRDVIKEEHTIEIFQNLKNSHLAILPGHTHLAPVNDPVLFNDLLTRFFEKPFTMPTTKAIME
ncbi:MAG: alpha/beta hydrolase [Emcibacter sp.]|nr:alpha/beta hydrolase [Emcibacter sp.]